MLSYVFFIFFLFFLSKSCCTVVFWALQLGISNLLSQEKKKSAGEYFLVKMCQQQSGLTSFFFSLCFWRQIQIDLFVFVYFLSISFFFSSPQPSQMIRLFCRFFQDYFSFFSIIPCRILGHFPRFHQSRQRYHYWICFFLVWQRHF